MVFEKATIVIGATDEEKSLIHTVETIVMNCDLMDIDSILIVIPENASDGCIEAIDYLKKHYPNWVRKFIQTHPYIGGAMRDSITETSSSHIMFLSADIPIGLESVPIMINESKKTPDAIIKISRWLEKGSFYNYNNVRKFFNGLSQVFLKGLYNCNLTDFTCPVLIGPTEIYKQLNFKEWNFPCLLEAVLLPVKIGCIIKEVPAKCYSRSEGKSKNSLWQTLLYFKVALRIRFISKKSCSQEQSN